MLAGNSGHLASALGGRIFLQLFPNRGQIPLWNLSVFFLLSLRLLSSIFLMIWRPSAGGLLEGGGQDGGLEGERIAPS